LETKGHRTLPKGKKGTLWKERRNPPTKRNRACGKKTFRTLFVSKTKGTNEELPGRTDCVKERKTMENLGKKSPKKPGRTMPGEKKRKTGKKKGGGVSENRGKLVAKRNEGKKKGKKKQKKIEKERWKGLRERLFYGKSQPTFLKNQKTGGKNPTGGTKNTVKKRTEKGGQKRGTLCRKTWGGDGIKKRRVLGNPLVDRREGGVHKKKKENKRPKKRNRTPLGLPLGRTS